MADRPVPQTAARTSDDEATAPVKRRPVLPPMPEQPSADTTQVAPRRAAVLPPPPEEETAVRAPRGRRLWANLTGSPSTEVDAPAVAEGVVPTSVAPRVAPAPVVRAPKPAKAARAAAGTASPATTRRPARRARLRLTRIDPWSVMKTAFLLSIAIGVVTVVSVMMVWTVLGAAGLWDSVNSTVQTVLGKEGDSFDVRDYLGTSRVLGFTIIASIIDVILLTAIATLAAFLYNLAAALLGGLEVTLTEDGS